MIYEFIMCENQVYNLQDIIPFNDSLNITSKIH
jgi:hypothetical protein